MSDAPVCPKCNEPIDNWAGNPGTWGVDLHYNSQGKHRTYHQHCVSETFREAAALRKDLARVLIELEKSTALLLKASQFIKARP